MEKVLIIEIVVVAVIVMSLFIAVTEKRLREDISSLGGKDDAVAYPTKKGKKAKYVSRQGNQLTAKIVKSDGKLLVLRRGNGAIFHRISSGMALQN